MTNSVPIVLIVLTNWAFVGYHETPVGDRFRIEEPRLYTNHCIVNVSTNILLSTNTIIFQQDAGPVCGTNRLVPVNAPVPAPPPLPILP